MYATGDITKRFGVSRQTVANWCREFAEFLSPTSNPPIGSQRRFTENDLSVLSLVYQQKRGGLRYDEITASLRSGQRAEPPEPHAIMAMTSTTGAMSVLQKRVSQLENEVEALRVGRDKAEGKVELLEKQLTDKEQQIRALYIELAEGKSKRRD